MDAKQYCEILNEGVVESSEKLDMEEGERYFQQENNPKHTSQLAITGFQTMISFNSLACSIP